MIQRKRQFSRWLIVQIMSSDSKFWAKIKFWVWNELVTLWIPFVFGLYLAEWPLIKRPQGRQFLKSIINSCLPSVFDELLILLWKEILFFEAADLEAISSKRKKEFSLCSFSGIETWKSSTLILKPQCWSKIQPALVKNNFFEVVRQWLFWRKECRLISKSLRFEFVPVKSSKLFHLLHKLGERR